MTIDEFMRDIAPKMCSGWVAMSAFGNWKYYCGNEPHITPCDWENAEKMAETLLMLSKMGAKGRNILELLVEKYKEGNN